MSVNPELGEARKQKKGKEPPNKQAKQNVRAHLGAHMHTQGHPSPLCSQSKTTSPLTLFEPTKANPI